jgi:hypothetical protein
MPAPTPRPVRAKRYSRTDLARPMSGFLRRLRRGKPKEEEEAEPSDAPGEAPPGDSDIYPHRDPDSTTEGGESGAPEGLSGPREEGGEVVERPPELPDEIGPAAEIPVGPPEAAPSDGSVLPAGPELPWTAPPRLPEAGAGASRSVHRPLTAPTHCFLCGTEMSGSFCPTCRMTWNE